MGDRPTHIVVAVILTEREYQDLLSGGLRKRPRQPVAVLTGPGTIGAAIRARLGWSEEPRGHTKDPEVISANKYRERQRAKEAAAKAPPGQVHVDEDD